MKENFKKIADRLLEVNLGIKALLGAEIPDNGDDAFDAFEAGFEKFAEKHSLIEKLKKLKNLSEQEFTVLKERDFHETWLKISELEAENLDLMKKLQATISLESVENKVHSRAISSYKFTKEVQPRLFDDSL